MARNPEFRSSEQRVRQPDLEPTPTVAAEPPKPGGVVDVDNDWLDIPEPGHEWPFDGQPVFLTPDGETAVEARFHKTKRFDAKIGRWVVTAFWVLWNSGNAPIDFTPIGVRRKPL